jgi:hypothetical protein
VIGELFLDLRLHPADNLPSSLVLLLLLFLFPSFLPSHLMQLSTQPGGERRGVSAH